jgi:hypothetical protein
MPRDLIASGLENFSKTIEARRIKRQGEQALKCLHIRRRALSGLRVKTEPALGLPTPIRYPRRAGLNNPLRAWVFSCNNY